MQRVYPMRECVLFRDQGKCALGNRVPLAGISEAVESTFDIRKIVPDRDIVLIGHEDIIVSAGDQDLTCLGACGLKIARRNAFGIDRGTAGCSC